MRRIQRREFLRQTGGVLGAAAAVGSAQRRLRAQSRPVGANERIRVAFIGTRGQGRFNLEIFLKEPGVEVPVVCDVNLLEAQKAQEMAGPQAEIVQDYRRLLDRKDIDAFAIATPDHWHAIPTIQGCQTGRDVYVEKPLSLCVAEGRRMVEAARKHNRIVQCGTQQRSGEHYAQGRDLVRAGKIGKVCHVLCWHAENRWPGVGHPPKQDPPETLDWDMWVGPRPFVPYNRSRCSGSHRFYWDYAGGTMTDMGTHHIETIQWFMHDARPVSASAAGGKVMGREPFETPDTLNALWEYPGWTLEFAIREASAYTRERTMYGILFYGSDAALYIDRAGFEIVPEKEKKAAMTVGTPRQENYQPRPLSVAHIRNFLACMRSRNLPNADVEIGHRATTTVHLANISYRTGRKIRWDAKTEQIADDPEASELLTRTYRPPYVLPEV